LTSDSMKKEKRKMTKTNVFLYLNEKNLRISFSSFSYHFLLQLHISEEVSQFGMIINNFLLYPALVNYLFNNFINVSDI